jgi:prepilin-type N-terminal cleavage/methylation domain-containing protein
MKHGKESGFSLVELLIAIVVTLFVSGAVYGLLASGNTAFKRDPELTERQQNIRVAMDLIQRDLSAAGNRLGPFAQAFLPGLDGAANPAIGVPSPGGGTTDALRLIGDAGDCPEIPTSVPPVTAASDNLNFAIDPLSTGCYADDQFVIVLYGVVGGNWALAHNVHGLQAINFPPGQQPPDSMVQCNDQLAKYGAGCPSPPGPPGSGSPTGMVSAALIRYEVNNIPGDTDNLGNAVPGLYRSGSGGMDTDGNYFRAADPAAPQGVWQLVARGIEEFQVEYRTAAVGGGWLDEPPTFVNPPQDADFNKIVRDVRVRLSARTINLEGTFDATTNLSALRADLTSVSAIRSALFYLTGNPANPWM